MDEERFVKRAIALSAPAPSEPGTEPFGDGIVRSVAGDGAAADLIPAALDRDRSRAVRRTSGDAQSRLANGRRKTESRLKAVGISPGNGPFERQDRDVAIQSGRGSGDVVTGFGTAAALVQAEDPGAVPVAAP